MLESTRTTISELLSGPDSQAAWDVLACLRGPDAEYSSAVKQVFTAVIRTAISPGIPYRGYAVRTSLSDAEDNLNLRSPEYWALLGRWWGAPENSHFVRHIERAFAWLERLDPRYGIYMDNVYRKMGRNERSVIST